MRPAPARDCKESRAQDRPNKDRTPSRIEEAGNTLLPDGTRTRDQKIATPDGERWIAWREVVVRNGDKTELQGVGRDVTDRVEAERALLIARENAEAASGAKSASSRRSRMKSAHP
jgi:hypothetical protein